MLFMRFNKGKESINDTVISTSVGGFKLLYMVEAQALAPLCKVSSQSTPISYI